MSLASADIFGIQMIKPTKTGGQVWYQYNVDFNDDPQVYTYSATNEYIIHDILDADGTRFTISSSDAFEVYISPTTGLNPSTTITDQQEMTRRGYMQSPQDWKNVECTMQIVLFAESNDFITLGFRGGRHQGSGAPLGCQGSGYLVDISMAQGGLIRVRKQTWNISVHNWLSTLASGFDSGKPCGFTFKVLVYNTQDVKGVNVEVYVASKNDNDFVKVLSGIDTGQINTDATVCNCTAQGQPLVWGAPTIMLKGTSGKFGFKNWSIREIEGYGTNLPPAPPPTGGGDPGTGGGGSGTGGGGSGTGGGGGTGGGEPVDLTPILATPHTSYVVSGSGPNYSPLDVHFIFAGAAWNSTATTSGTGGGGQNTPITTYSNPILAAPKSTGIKDMGGPVWDKAVVFFIFWGSRWNTQNSPWSRKDLTDFINVLFDPTKGYFDGLIQYKYARRPTIGGFITNTSVTPHDGYVGDEVTDFIISCINSGQVPNPRSNINTRFMYFVFGPPDHLAAPLTQGAWHFSYNTQYPATAIQNYIVLGHVGYVGTFAQQTFGISHELASMISDPLGEQGPPPMDGFIVDPNGPLKDDGPEISDVCADEDKTFSGYTVCPYWSNQDNDCIVTTGKPSWVSCPSGSTWDNGLQQCKKTTTTPPPPTGGGSTANQTLKTQITNSINIVFGPNSNYFKGLIQYGLTKTPVAKSFSVNTTFALANNYTQAQLNSFIDDSIAKGLVPKNTATDHKNVYCVILPPNIKNSAGETGQHYARTFGTGSTAYYDPITSICPTTTSDYNLFTRNLTKFLVAMLTNNSGSTYMGYYLKAGTPMDPKIALFGKEISNVCFDDTADNTISGVSVCKYWSDQDGKCIIPPLSGNPTPFISCHTGAIYDNVTQSCIKQTGSGGGGTTPPGPQGYKIVEAKASDDDGNVPANAIDGKLDTRWSAFGKGQYLRLDLGEAKPIDKIKIAWYQGDKRTNEFEIKTADTTGGEYTSRLKTTSVKGSTALQDYAITPATTSRYVRIYCYGNSLNDWCSISEVEIWGVPIVVPPPGGGDGGGDPGGGTGTEPPKPDDEYNFFDTSFSIDHQLLGLCDPIV